MKKFLLLLCVLGSQVHGKAVSLADPSYLQNIEAIQYGQTLTLTDVSLDHLGPVTLLLKSQKVFADQTEIIIHSVRGVIKTKPPSNRYFSGSIKGKADSRVFIGFLENGKIEGVIDSGADEKYVMKWQLDNQFKLIDQNNSAQSANDHRWFNPIDFLNLPPDQVQINKVVAADKSTQGNTAYQLTLAIETDFEFYNKFGNSNDTVNYIAGLVGYISSIYTDEIATSILVGTTSLWTNNASSDPWDATSTECALYEVGKYWNDNHSNVDRALTHFISGKSSNSGIAWVGVLCSGGFNYTIPASCNNISNYAGTTSNYGGGYGVSSGLDVNFDNNNLRVWDSVVVSHELGHNFNSPHTHCYEGIGGNNNPVDECNNSEGANQGCYSGAQSLPGPSGQGSGTIMSYCHLLSPGLSNLSMTLGTGHNFGVAPDRVPNRMRSHVESVATSNPQCIVPLVNDLIFENGFEGIQP